MQNLKALLQNKIKNETPFTQFFSPGRINLIGEHIDYKGTGGKVLPAAISLGIHAYAAKSEKVFVYSNNVPEMGWVEAKIDFNSKYNPKDGYLNMINGVISQLVDFKEKLGGITVVLESTIPIASGLSSSAAFNVLLFTIFNELYQLGLTSTEIAIRAQKVENEYIGLNSGIMDQFIIANGKKDTFMLLDTATLKFEYVSIPAQKYDFFIINTNKKRELACSAYNKRVRELKDVMQTFNANGLSFKELKDANHEKYLNLIQDNTLRRRFKHVLTEINRVEKTFNELKTISGEELGAILNAAHSSLRDDYEVSCPEADFICYRLFQMSEIYGARIIGAGFGGCILVVAKPGTKKEAFKFADEYSAKFNCRMDVYDFKIEDGARKI